jgi:uncharacterized membrane protein (DUF485 family)
MSPRRITSPTSSSSNWSSRSFDSTPRIEAVRDRPLGAWRSAWWRTHQVMTIGLYVVAVSLSWYVKEWVKVPVTVAVFIGLGAGAAIGGILRGHLCSRNTSTGRI